MINKVLEKALRESIGQDEIVLLLEEVQTIDRFLELAQVASKVRDREVGEVFKFDGFVGSITPCTTNPPCKFCGSAVGNRSDFSDKPLTVAEIELAAKLMENVGIKRIELGGGTLWDGAGEKVLEAVEAVQKVSSSDIWINVGPSLNADDLKRLKELRVSEVCSSLEAINADVFEEVKPGDSLKARMELTETIDGIGLGLTSVMMVGIGSAYDDYARHLLWLKGFKNLSHFCITGLNPIPGTAYQNKPIANPFEVAKIGAIARLLFRDVDISFGGMMNDPRLLPLCIMGGGNRTIHLGVHVHRDDAWQIRNAGSIVEKHGDLEFVNMLPLTARIVKEMGKEVDVA